jgi:hypothetical protein
VTEKIASAFAGEQMEEREMGVVFISKLSEKQ